MIDAMSNQSLPCRVSPGRPLPLGPTFSADEINLALFARHADRVALVFEFEDEPAADRTFSIDLDGALNRTGDIWHIGLATDGRAIRYGFRVDGREDPAAGLYFYPDVIAIDPYCRHLVPRPWGQPARTGKAPLCLAAPDEPFDWQGDRPLNRPAAETIIYELHVRGFTRHPSANVGAPGTFRGLVEKIPYLQELGITAVELLPVTRWDELDNTFFAPDSGALLPNYWGYNPISFFALQTGLAADPKGVVNEFRAMVRSFHQADIEVIVDVVFNHSGESDYTGTTSSFRAIDNPVYYMIGADGTDYRNYTGCGNTVNCNHPVVSRLIIDALRSFVSDLHVDGFRFDLAAIFSRGNDGEVLADPPLIEMIAEDPVLRNTKIIAEAWDAAGLYQVGTFSENSRWVEWNGRFRDDVRRFMAAHPDTVRTLATRIAGSSDLYQDEGRGPLNSVNFITCHDGFTLYDLVSYEQKRNEGNGEDNQDGENHNLSWNSGHEGSPAPDEIEAFRQRRMRTFAALLLFSQGIPMLTAGDEFARTQRGNNNGWCQDNDISWLDWGLAEKNQGLLRFFRECIALRRRHPVFRRSGFFAARPGIDPATPPEIAWQALTPGNEDWSAGCRVLGFLLNGSAEAGDDSSFFVMVNGDRAAPATFTVPPPAVSESAAGWHRRVDTAAPSPGDIVDLDQADQIEPGAAVTVAPMTLVMLQSPSS